MSHATPLTLARQFLAATVDVWGCDRIKANEVLRDVQNLGAQRDFTEQLWSLSTFDKKLRSTYEGLGVTENNYRHRLVPAILEDEMSGAGLQKALSYLPRATNKPNEANGSDSDNFVQGIKDSFDEIAVGAHRLLGVIDRNKFAAWAVMTAGGVALYYGGAYLAKAAPYLMAAGISYHTTALTHSLHEASKSPASSEERARAFQKAGSAFGNLGQMAMQEGVSRGLRTVGTAAISLLTKTPRTPSALPGNAIATWEKHPSFNHLQQIAPGETIQSQLNKGLTLFASSPQEERFLKILFGEGPESTALIGNVRKAVAAEILRQGGAKSLLQVDKAVETVLKSYGIDMKAARIAAAQRSLALPDPSEGYKNFLGTSNVIDHLSIRLFPDNVRLYRTVAAEAVQTSKRVATMSPNKSGMSYWGVGAQGKSTARKYTQEGYLLVETTMGTLRKSGMPIWDKACFVGNAVETYHQASGPGFRGVPVLIGAF